MLPLLSRARIKNVTHPLQEIRGRHRLGDKMQTCFENTFFRNHLRRISAHKEHLGVRSYAPDCVVYFPPVLLRHNGIDKNELDRITMLAELGHGIFAVLGLDYGIPEFLEYLSCELPDNSVILGHKDRFRAADLGPLRLGPLFFRRRACHW